MSRVARIVVPGVPHHITQRGNRRADVFFSDEDRRAYLRWLREYSVQHGLAIWAYCLMTNHVHVVAVPRDEQALSRSFRCLHTAYALRFNAVNNTCGHLWQGRFGSTPLDDTHLWAAVRYVERNPVRAGMIQFAADYPWSSAQAHCGLRDDPLLDDGFPPAGAVEDWAAWLLDPNDEAVNNTIRRRTHTGRPCGGPSFVAKLEQILQRRIRPRKPGRKPKRAAQTAITNNQRTLFDGNE